MAFLIANHFLGLRAALISIIACIFIEIIIFRIYKKKISNFFKFFAAITTIFGFIDLYLDQVELIKYEAVLTNFCFGIYFYISLFNGGSLIMEFAKSWKLIPEKIDLDLEKYLRLLTIIWAFYFFIRAIIYAFIAYNFSFEKFTFIRIVFGKITLVILVLISVFGHKLRGFLKK
jgi:intracellular septation protein A